MMTAGTTATSGVAAVPGLLRVNTVMSPSVQIAKDDRVGAVVRSHWGVWFAGPGLVGVETFCGRYVGGAGGATYAVLSEFQVASKVPGGLGGLGARIASAKAGETR